MCIRDSFQPRHPDLAVGLLAGRLELDIENRLPVRFDPDVPVSYTHLRAHETVLDLVCRLLLEKKKVQNTIEQLLNFIFTTDRLT